MIDKYLVQIYDQVTFSGNWLMNNWLDLPLKWSSVILVLVHCKDIYRTLNIRLLIVTVDISSFQGLNPYITFLEPACLDRFSLEPACLDILSLVQFIQ